MLLLGLDNAGKTTLLEQMKAGQSKAPREARLRTVPTVGQNVTVLQRADLSLRVWDVGGQHSLRRLWHSYYSACHAIVFVIDSSDVGDADIARLAARHRRRGRPGPGAAIDTSQGAGAADALHGAGAAMDPDAGAGAGADAGADADADAVAGGVTDADADADANAAGVTDDTRHAGTHSTEPDPGRDLDVGRLDECRLVLEDVLQHSDAAALPLLVLANKQDREDCVEVVRIKEAFVRPVFEGDRGGGVRDSRVLPCSALTGVGVAEAVDWLCSRVVWNKEGRPPVLR